MRTLVAGKVGFLLCFWVYFGCAKPIALEAPTASAPVADRLAAYEELKPLEIQSSTVMYYNPQSGGVSTRTYTYLHLANGMVISDPALLLPVVFPDSETARWAEEYRTSKNWTRVSTLASSVSGLGMTLLLVSTDLLEAADTTQVVLFGGLATTLLSSAITSIVFRAKTTKARLLSFEAYDQSLKDYLGLCRASLKQKRLTGCEELVSQPATPPEAPVLQPATPPEVPVPQPASLPEAPVSQPATLPEVP